MCMETQDLETHMCICIQDVYMYVYFSPVVASHNYGPLLMTVGSKVKLVLLCM